MQAFRGEICVPASCIVNKASCNKPPMRSRPRTGVTARRRIGLRDAAAAGQVALALLLLVAGGLLVRSFLPAQRVDPGFTARGVVAMTMSLPARYAAPEQRVDFFATLESRVAALPGTRAAGLARRVGLAGEVVALDIQQGMIDRVTGNARRTPDDETQLISLSA